jgi:hypothetical protein
MKPLANDERASTVMVYTQSMLIRGEIVLRDTMRASIWLRTQGVPNFIHLFNAQVIQLAGTPAKNYSKPELFLPASEIIGFHLAPPAQDPLDYDASETNRRMQPIQILMGSFVASWLSLYEADISNPYLPQLSLQVPMLLVKPNKMMIGLM